jgi:hypothetical protein
MKILKVVAIVFLAVSWTCEGIILVDQQIAKHGGSWGGIRFSQTLGSFKAEHSWREYHRDRSYRVVSAPSYEAAEEELARIIFERGYRLPRWWEVNRWDENIPKSFRKRMERLEASK